MAKLMYLKAWDKNKKQKQKKKAWDDICKENANECP